jgi:cobalt/nickel transport protein
MRRNLILLAVAAAIVVLPLLIKGDAEFSGSDGQAQGVIDGAGYRPWFEPLWKPPSREIEGLLFALQAALGAGLLGYYVGLRRGRGEGRNEGRNGRDNRGGIHAGD